jgi:predicted amino acid-binding ACT domain protein
VIGGRGGASRSGILADVSPNIAGINTNIRNVEATTMDQLGA